MFAEFLLQKQEKYQIKYDFLDECEIFYNFFQFLILRHSIYVVLMMASESNKLLNFFSCYARLLYYCEYTYLLEHAVARIMSNWGGAL